MPKIVVKEKKREEIYEALDKCLLEKPFSQTSIKDIAKKAGVNHGMLHYYFANKEDILLRYIDYKASSIISTNEEEINRKLTEEDSSPEALRAFFIGMFKQVTFDQNLSRIFVEIWANGNYNEKVREKLQSIYDNFLDTYRRRINLVVQDDTTSNGISFSLLALFEGISLFSTIYDKEDFDAETTMRRFAKKMKDFLEIMR